MANGHPKLIDEIPDPAQRQAAIDAWEERMAICMHDGNLTEEAARDVAMVEVLALCPVRF